MKSYTDLEQSKILAEILPIESADMCWQQIYDENHMMSDHRVELLPYRLYSGIGVPCWSLSALLDAMPPIQELCSSTDHYYRVHCMNLFSEWHDNAIDSCVEMIVRLHKEELL